MPRHPGPLEIDTFPRSGRLGCARTLCEMGDPLDGQAVAQLPAGNRPAPRPRRQPADGRAFAVAAPGPVLETAPRQAARLAWAYHPHRLSVVSRQHRVAPRILPMP